MRIQVQRARVFCARLAGHGHNIRKVAVVYGSFGRELIFRCYLPIPHSDAGRELRLHSITVQRPVSNGRSRTRSGQIRGERIKLPPLEAESVHREVALDTWRGETACNNSSKFSLSAV